MSSDFLTTFSERIEGDYEMFPFAFQNVGGMSTHYYDNKNKRFVTIGFGQRELGYPSTTTTGSTPFKLSNIGTTFMFADYNSSTRQVVITSDTNKKYIYTINFSGDNISRIDAYPIQGIASLNNIMAFAASSESLIGFIADGNKIYRVEAGTGAAKEIYACPEGTEIADLQMYKRPNKSIGAGTL